MRTKPGYVKLYSSILKEKLSDGEYAFFTQSMLLANPGGKSRGVVDASIRELAEALDRSRDWVDRMRSKVAKRGLIKVHRGGFLIVGYEKYQGLVCQDSKDKQGHSLSGNEGQQVSNLMTLSQDSKDNKSGNEGQTTPEIESKTKKILKDKEEEIDKEIPEVRQLFNHWNAAQVIVHHVLTDKTRRTIRARLKEFSFVELCKAISVYAGIVNDATGQYFWTHRWTLHEFLQRGVERFLDEQIAKQNCRRKNGGQGHGNSAKGLISGPKTLPREHDAEVNAQRAG